MTDLKTQLEDKKKEFIEGNKTSWKFLKRKGFADAEYYGDCIFLEAPDFIDGKPTKRNIFDEFVDAILEQAIAEMQKQRQDILDLFGEETKKEWEDGFYENEWDCDTLKVTPLEAKIVSELTSFLPRHMEVYDWNLPYAEEIILIIRRVIKEQLNQPKTEK